MNTSQTNGSAEYFDTIVIGGGQAGLAVGYHLARQGCDFVILDAHERVGDAWRQRWDSLRLFTPAKYDGLPGTRFPGDRLAFPTKDEQADFLERYAVKHDLPVRTGVRVDRLWREGESFSLTAGGRRFTADHVVIATGPHHTPRVPDFARELSPSLVQLHSHAYRGPWQLQAGDALVVGVGNSGAEIALELSRSRRTWLAGKETAEIPVRHGRAAARFALPVVRFLGMHVLTLNTPIGRKVSPGFAAHGTFVGQEFQFAALSATIPGVGRDAEYVARHIASTGASSTASAGWRAAAIDGRRSA